MKNSTTTKPKKAGLYDPYLDIMGGGERLILSILQVIQGESVDINIFWDIELNLEIKNKLHLSFTPEATFRPNLFQYKNNYLTKLLALRDLDFFFYVPDGSYFLSSAKKNYIFSMVPEKKLYPTSLINKAKTYNYTFITISQFTKKWLKKWGITSTIIFPYITNDFFNINIKSPKKKQILCVGRFFPHLHSKRQDIAIENFIKLQNKNVAFSDYSLHLAGNITKEDGHYLKSLKKLAKNNPSIFFHPNIAYSELLKLYETSKYFWHFAGYDVDETIHPERTEHLGIAPLEAMASGCITLAYKAGGPKELIEDSQNGYLFLSDSELQHKMDYLERSPQKVYTMVMAARKFVENNFSYEIFSKRVKEVFL